MSGYNYFAVISGDPYYATESETAFFRTLGDAVDYRDADTAGLREVYALKPLPDSALWEWAVDPGSGHGPMEYVSESAARNCAGSGALLRRRAGSSGWTPVPTGGAG